MSDGFGLNKRAALEAEREARAEAARAEPQADGLNPPWPWAVVPFDPAFFQLDGDPVPDAGD
jgi:hypothetical protein